MECTVRPIPEGFRTLTPYLIVGDVERELDFATRAFGAKTIHITRAEGGAIRHATIQIGDSMLMMGQASGTGKSVPSMLYMYVPDVDAVFQKAIECGANSVREPTNEFYGDRAGGVESRNGIQWWIGTHIEDVSEEELQRRHAARAATH